MFDGHRLRAVMAERAVSQSELARRIGVSQASIYRLVAGEAYGTKHLHKIARELGTTPAYLEGETDDPHADAPAAPELAFDERELVDCYRSLRPADQAALMHIACSMAGRSGKPPTVHAPRMDFGLEPTR